MFLLWKLHILFTVNEKDVYAHYAPSSMFFFTTSFVNELHESSSGSFIIKGAAVLH